MGTLNEVATRVWKARAAALTLFLLTVWTITLPYSYGQVVNANLFGTVTDPSGAVVPDVRITLTNVDRGFILNSESDSTGAYTFPAVPPGEYRLGATKEGFKATSISGIKLLV